MESQRRVRPESLHSFVQIEGSSRERCRLEGQWGPYPWDPDQVAFASVGDRETRKGQQQGSGGTCVCKPHIKVKSNTCVQAHCCFANPEKGGKRTATWQGSCSTFGSSAPISSAYGDSRSRWLPRVAISIAPAKSPTISGTTGLCSFQPPQLKNRIFFSYCDHPQ